jgi:hypothetical protein
MKTNWLVAAVVVGVLVIVGAVVAARLADDDFSSVETTEWAESVCASLAEWRGEITSLAGVQGELTPEAFEEALDDAGAATDDLVDDLRRLGPPDLEAGDEAEQALDDAAEGLRDGFDSLRDDARDALDAETPSASLQELAELAPRAQALVQQAQDVIAALRSASLFGESSAELEQAFASAPSCAQLQGTG